MRKTTTSATTTTLPKQSYVLRDFSLFSSLLSGLLGKLKRQNQTQELGSMDKPQKKKNIFFPVAALMVLMGLAIVISGRTLFATTKPKAETKATIQGPKATLTLNKEFSFPLTDAKGKELTRLKYTIENAELRDEIIVKGTRAVAIKGRTFLILNVKLVNDYDKALQINARDYIRLSVNNNETELLAADIHNDPVSVQPISTKTTRIGFPINDTDTQLVLKVGEIKGTKENVALNF